MRIGSVCALPNRRRDGSNDGLIADGGQTPANLDRAVSRLGEGFATLDTDWTITSLNDAGRDILDVDGPEGQSFWEVISVPPSIRESFETAVAREKPMTETIAVGDGAFQIRVFPDETGVSVVFSEADDGREANEAALRRLHAVAADSETSGLETIERMLDVGRDRLGVDLGFLTQIEDDTQEIVRSVGDRSSLERGTTIPLSKAYCRRTIETERPLSVLDATEEGWGEDPAYRESGLSCYLGTTVDVEGAMYGTLCFADTTPRDRAFSDADETFVELLADWVSYILERERYESELREERHRLETVTDNLPVVVFAFDTESVVTLARGRGLDALGIDPSAAVGESIFELFDDPTVLDHVERALAGSETHQTVEIADGATLDVWYQPVLEDGSVEQVVGVAQDVTERRAHRARLSGLLSTTQSLMQARSREEVAEIAVDAAADVLGFDTNLMRLYDAAAETLESAAQTGTVTDYLGDRPVYDVGEGLPGEVFATGESRIVDDFSAIDADVETGAIRSAIYYPVGVHGTMSIGSTEPGAFDETDEQILALLATAAAAACTRAKREREVREARAHVETVLDRINGLIEDTVEVLVQAATREEIEAGVVTELAAADPYTFAWVGRQDVAGSTLEPIEWAGEASVPAADLAFDLDGENPVAAAVRTGELQVDGFDAHESADADYDRVETTMVVPLVYKETTYGVVAVFADEPGAFDEREQIVLGALGRAIANAINAVERGRILDADRVIELEFTVADDDILLARLSRQADCSLASAGTDYRADGSLQMYLTATGVGGAELLDIARADPAVTEATCIADHDDECLLELVVEESLVATLTEYGAAPQSVTAENGTVRVTVELPYEAEARELFDRITERYPRTDLVGYHEHERPVETRQEFRASLAERFTDRQETALRTAYLGGFFDWPRRIDGNELADAMDISRPTYHQHLRAAQQKVLEELFGEADR